MGAAVGVVADVIWTAAVSAATSKVVTKVAKKIGLSDDASSIIGAVTGMAAGGAVWGKASSALNSAGFESVSNPWVSADATKVKDAAEGAGNVDMTKTGGNPPGGGAPAGGGGAAKVGAAGDYAKTVGIGAVSGMAQGYIQGQAMEDAEASRIREQQRVEELDQQRIDEWMQSAENLPPRALRNFGQPPNLGPYPGQLPEFQGVQYPAAGVEAPQVQQPGGLLRQGMQLRGR